MGRTKIKGGGCLVALLLLLYWIIAKIIEVTVIYLEKKSYSTIRNFNACLLLVLIGELVACYWIISLLGGTGF